MEFIRIGEKLISAHKIKETIKQILHCAAAFLQQEVAAKLQIDRTLSHDLNHRQCAPRCCMGLVAFRCKIKRNC